MEDFDFESVISYVKTNKHPAANSTIIRTNVVKKFVSYENRIIFLSKKISKLFNININKYENFKDIHNYYYHWLAEDTYKYIAKIIQYIYYLTNIYKTHFKFQNIVCSITEKTIHQDLLEITKKISVNQIDIQPIFFNKYGSLINDMINDLDSKIEKEFEERAKKQAIIDSRITELQELIRKKHESIDKTISELTTNINTIDDAMKLFINKFDEVLINNQKMNEQLQQCMYNQAQLVKIIKMAFMFKSDMFNEEQQKMIESCL